MLPGGPGVAQRGSDEGERFLRGARGGRVDAEALGGLLVEVGVAVPQARDEEGAVDVEDVGAGGAERAPDLSHDAVDHEEVDRLAGARDRGCGA